MSNHLIYPSKPFKNLNKSLLTPPWHRINTWPNLFYYWINAHMLCCSFSTGFNDLPGKRILNTDIWLIKNWLVFMSAFKNIYPQWATMKINQCRNGSVWLWYLFLAREICWARVNDLQTKDLFLRLSWMCYILQIKFLIIETQFYLSSIVSSCQLKHKRCYINKVKWHMLTNRMLLFYTETHLNEKPSLFQSWEHEIPSLQFEMLIFKLSVSK